MTVTPITPLPVAPSRQRPLTFSAEGDAFLSALPVFGTELNTVAGETSANAAVAVAAADGAALSSATANFLGAWEDLSGVVNVPSAVLYSDKYWSLLTDLQDVTTVIPGEAVVRSWTSVCWSPELGIFCAVAASGTGNRAMTSTDGTTWKLRETPADNDWYSICWSQELSLFCAVASSGAGNRVMTSPDGITWTLRTSPSDNSWKSVCWSPGRDLFCAVSVGSDVVMTSPDGITWTLHTLPITSSLYSICWAESLGIFCAVSYSGTGNRVMTSPDGTTWTVRTSPADYVWASICWSPELSLFCAVASSGTGDRVMTSPNGVTWTLRTSAADNSWVSVCWSSEFNLFCASSITGTDNRVMTSPNGIDWTIRTTASNEWYSVCWSAELSKFSSVSFNGPYTRTMYSGDGLTWTQGNDPGAWAEIVVDTSSTGGSKSWNVSVDTELTYERVHMVSTSVSNLAISIPATLLTDQGYPLIVIKNTGGEIFFLKNSSGAYLTRVQPGETFLVSLTDYATQTYAVEKIQLSYPGVTAGNTSVVASYGTSDFSIAALDSTRLVASWYSSSTTVSSAVVTVSGLGVSVGTPYVITAASAMSDLDVKKIDTDKLILSYTLAGDTYLKSVVLTASGTTLTGGSVNSSGFAGSSCAQIVLSATRVLIGYFSTSTLFKAAVASISGTTVTYGTPLSVEASSSDSRKPILTYLTSTTVLATYFLTSGPSCVVLSIADTTVTKGTAVATSISASYYSTEALSSTKAIIVTGGGTPYYNLEYNLISISGTTITMGGLRTLQLGATVSTYPHLTPVDPETVLLDVGYTSGGTPLLGAAHRYSILTVSGNFVTEMNSAPAISASTGIDCANTVLDTGTHVSLFSDEYNSSYLSVRIIKLGVA